MSDLLPPGPGAEVLPASLAFSVVEGFEARPEGPTAVILHGMLGSGGNWRSFARRWVIALPAWTVVLPDLRNHGGSVGATAPHSVDACAADVAALCEGVGRRVDVVVGHSFGGKVALRLATRGLLALRQVWSVDSPPGVRQGGSQRMNVEQVIGALRSVPLPLPTRAAVVPALRDRGLPMFIAQWMTTNLRRVDGGFAWTLELDAAAEMVASFGALDCWPIVDAPPEGLDVRLVRAVRSDVWSADDDRRFCALAASERERARWVPDAGHWVHVDNPDGLWDVLAPHLTYQG